MSFNTDCIKWCKSSLLRSYMNSYDIFSDSMVMNENYVDLSSVIVILQIGHSYDMLFNTPPRHNQVSVWFVKNVSCMDGM